MSKRWMLWAIFGAFATFVVLLFFQMAAPAQGHEQHEGQHTVNLPDTWLGYTRTDLVQGPEALKEIDRLHNKSIQIHDGYRADYVKGQEQFTVWIATTAGEAEAQALRDQMTKAIGAANAMFSQPVPVSLAGLTAYRSTAMGQTHFYYVKGAAVYWIALTSSDPNGLAARIIAGL